MHFCAYIGIYSDQRDAQTRILLILIPMLTTTIETRSNAMATIKDVIKKFTGADTEAEKVRERLELLKNSAEAHLKIALQELKDSLRGQGDGIEALYIVPDSLVRADMGLHVAAKESMDDGLKSAVDLFFGGSKPEVKDGFRLVVQSALGALFADTTSGEQTKKLYFVTMESNAFVRVDVFVWKYYFGQKGLCDDVQQAFCYAFTKSIIDHTKVSADTMVYLISQHVGDDLEKVEAFVTEIRKLYGALKDKDPINVAADIKKLEDNVPADAVPV